MSTFGKADRFPHPKTPKQNRIPSKIPRFHFPNDSSVPQQELTPTNSQTRPENFGLMTPTCKSESESGKTAFSTDAGHTPYPATKNTAFDIMEVKIPFLFFPSLSLSLHPFHFLFFIFYFFVIFSRWN